MEAGTTYLLDGVADERIKGEFVTTTKEDGRKLGCLLVFVGNFVGILEGF
jgi:hypothetical protein